MPSGFQLARDQAEAYESFTRTFMDGSARLLATGASIGPGDVVLDLACGTGLVAAHALDLVGPCGRIVGADINPAMIAIARSRRPGPVDWIEAPCDALPFDDATFTHAICQQGLQFFPDPVGALRETLRVLRPGGAVVATIWATPGHNPYIEHQLDLLADLDTGLVASVVRATPPDADRLMASSARSAGFADIEVALLEHTVEIPDFDRWFLSQTSGTPWGPTVAALDAERRVGLVDAMLERMAPFATASGHRVPFASHRLHARRPAGEAH